MDIEVVVEAEYVVKAVLEFIITISAVKISIIDWLIDFLDFEWL